MTLRLKGTPRKGKLGSSPDGLNLFYTFSFIYRYAYMCIYLHKYMYAYTAFEFLRTESSRIRNSL